MSATGYFHGKEAEELSAMLSTLKKLQEEKTKEKDLKNLLTNSKKIFLYDNCKLRRRELDKVLKEQKYTCKRTNDIHEADVVVFPDVKSYGTYFYTRKAIRFNGELREWLDWNSIHTDTAFISSTVGYMLIDHFKDKLTTEFNVTSMWDLSRIKDPIVIKEIKDKYLYPYVESYGMTITSNYSAIQVSHLGLLKDKKIIHEDNLRQYVFDALSDGKESAEELSFEALHQLLISKDESNYEIALGILKSYDSRDIYYELLLNYMNGEYPDRFKRDIIMQNPALKNGFFGRNITFGSWYSTYSLNTVKNFASALLELDVEVDKERIRKDFFDISDTKEETISALLISFGSIDSLKRILQLLSHFGVEITTEDLLKYLKIEHGTKEKEIVDESNQGNSTDIAGETQSSDGQEIQQQGVSIEGSEA